MVWIYGSYGYICMVLIVMHDGIYPDVYMKGFIKDLWSDTTNLSEPIQYKHNISSLRLTNQMVLNNHLVRSIPIQLAV